MYVLPVLEIVKVTISPNNSPLLNVNALSITLSTLGIANLEIANQTARENMTATNQERLAEMQMAADFLSKNAAFAQQMEVANLSNEQQIRLANLTLSNGADLMVVAPPAASWYSGYINDCNKFICLRLCLASSSL